MIRSLAIALVLAMLPLAPAAAVVTVAISAGEKPVLPPARMAQPAPDDDLLGLSFGEIAAALAGLAIIGVVMFGGRQPPSVTA